MFELMLPGTDVAATRLGFGCARMMRVQGRRKRDDIIAAALDAGIGYFDAAPMYGMGVVEGELSRGLGPRRNDVTIATKFGIEARSGLLSNPVIQGLARRVISLLPALKKAARRSAGVTIKAREYDVASAIKSLERSLRKLKIEKVGVLLVHEPAPEELTDDKLLPWLESLAKDGMIGTWGVGGEVARTLNVDASFPDGFPVLQFDNDAVNRQIERHEIDRRRALITYSPMHDAFSEVRDLLSRDKAMATRWSDSTGADFTVPDTIARYLLTYAVRANPHGVVLYSTSSPGRLEQAARWVREDSVPDDSLRSFLGLLSETVNAGASR